MKYIYSILGIVLLISGVFAVISLQPSGDPPGKNALVVNDRVISFAELQRMWQQKPYHYRDQDEFIDDLVLRELLIQQAITAGLAEDEQFKRLIKDFFEQSLVKTLLDHKQREQPIAIPATELARFRAALQLRYHLTLLRYKSSPDALAEEAAEEQRISEDFSALPEALQVRLFTMQPKQISVPFKDGVDVVRIRLDQVEERPLSAETTISDAELRQHLSDLQQQKFLAAWLLQLREQATILYPQQQLETGGE